MMGAPAFAQDAELQLYSFDGVLAQQWTLPAAICYAKSHSATAGGESIFLGLVGGALVQIVPGQVDAAQVDTLLAHGTAIRCCFASFLQILQMNVSFQAAQCVGLAQMSEHAPSPQL